VRFGARAGADEPSSTNLLLKLIEQDVEAARQFVRALKDAGLRPSSMVHDVSSASAIEIAQRLLPAEAASTSSLLFRMLWSLPPAHRPFPDAAMNAVVLGEALDHGGAEEFGPAAVARVLRRIFGSTIAQETLDVLIATATHLRDSGEFPSAQVQGVKAAFELLMTPGEDEPPKKAAPDVALSHDESIALEWLQHPEDVPDAPGPTRLADDALRLGVVGALARAPGMVRRVLLERVGDRHARLRWATILSESELVRLAHVLEPRGHRVLLEAAELLFSSWLSVTPDRSSASTHRPAFWSFFLQALSGVSGSESSLERMVRSFFVDFGAHDRSKTESSPGSQGRGAATGAALVDAAAVVAAEAGSTALRAILERERATLLALWRGDSPASSSATDVRPPLLPGRGDLPARGGRVRGRAAFSMVDESADIGDEPIYIANAGLILASPFLPQLFQALDMLEPTEGGKSRVIADQISRATHLLQWLVDGRTSAPEPLLCLNKLLCGVPLPTPVERTIEPTPRDLEVCSTLLTSMIANWPIIRNTSIEGLRETFLQREGRLQQSPDGWRLHVQRKTLDVLLDQIPWSISTIVHAWMPAPIFVTW
jgi:hypothetical protein